MKVQRVLSLVLAGAAATLLARAIEAAPQEPVTKAQVLATDTPSTTTAGHTFIAPAGWSLSTRGKVTMSRRPRATRESCSWTSRRRPDAAIKEAWAAYRPDAAWPLKAKTSSSDKDGWTNQHTYSYQTSPNERRGVAAGTARHGDANLVWIFDMSDPVAEKRGAQVTLIFGRLFPKGYARESFAGKKAHALDAARLKELGAFIERAQTQLGVPGVSLAIAQDGKVVFAGGFGVRELGKPEKVDADTLYIIASNTKAMTTMLLGRLVDQKKITWETPVTNLLPQFKLGDEGTTRQVQVQHLICACTGLPRQDFEWLLEFGKATPDSALVTLGTMQPTSKFGEMFQYSNPLAAAGGYLGAHVMFPEQELGAAYDRAMDKEVFGPLGMTSTTFDFKKALAGNHASAHSLDIDGRPALAAFDVNYSIVPCGRRAVRGAASTTCSDTCRWSSRRPSARRRALRVGSRAEGTPGAEGLDRQGRLVRHGADGGPGLRHACRAPRRQHDRLQERHDVAAGARRGRGRADERRPGRGDLGQLPAQAPRGAVRRQGRGRQRRRGRGQGNEGADRGRAQAPHCAARSGRGGEARPALRERRAR